MSEIVRNEFGDEWTAFQLQDKFLEDGTQFSRFTCKYCDTEVRPVAIYGGEFEKAPHFRLKDSFKPHHPTECFYGADTKVDKRIARKPKKKYQFNVVLPECFVALRPSPQSTRVASALPNKPPSEDEIRMRVQNAANLGVISNHYTTGLLKTLVDARRAAIKAIYGLPAVKKIEKNEDRTKQVFEELEKAPLKLYGRELSYRSAFCKPKYTPRRGAFIYFGEAEVASVIDGFLLTAKEEISLKTDEGTVNEKITKTPVHVKYVCQKALPVNHMDECIMASLSNAELKNESIKWYAYGVLEPNNARTAYELIVREYAHFYVESSTR